MREASIIHKRLRQLCRYGLLMLVSLPSISITYATEVVLVNRPLSAEDKRYDYPHKLLANIFRITEAQYGPARVKRAHQEMARDRTLIELENGLDIHVIAEAPKPDWEKRLIPVRIPIRKGIQGYRTFLILQKNQSMLSKITSLEQLKKIPTGSGKQWSTTRVLEENGFDVIKGTNYEGLFAMLIRERFVTFGRGINEIEVEYEVHKEKSPELAIEEDLLLYIPLPTYFFVTPTKPKLAKRIEQGLLAMIKDGSFNALFTEEYGELIKRANLSKRRMFSINNPNLTSETPLNIKSYWYRP